MDPAAIATETGWTVHHHVVVDSTNDVAAELVRGGAGARVAVVADEQRQGRGREGRCFASPEGGLYVSLLVAARSEDLPAGTVALIALAAAEAIEAGIHRPVSIKWPNDLWIDGKKVGGILLETTQAGGPIVAGLGLNVAAVPPDLPADIRAETSSLADAAGRPVDQGQLLTALLVAVDRLQDRRAQPGGGPAIEQAWRGRLALLGERVTCRSAGAQVAGVLEDVSLADGLRIRDPRSGAAWHRAEHVQDLRPL